MMIRLMVNDIKHNKFFSGMAIFFMAISAMLTVLTALLFSGLLGAIDALMGKAQVPDYMQMHAGTLEIAQIACFVEQHEEIIEWQVCRFLNLNNSQVTLGGHSLADSTQDNGLSVQGERFDYLLGLMNDRPEVLPGEVYVPSCYRIQYGLAVGDLMEIGEQELVITGFLRDAQMNSMMASSKRFLVCEADYERIRERDGHADGYATGGERQDVSGSSTGSEYQDVVKSSTASAYHNMQEEYLIEFLLRDGTDTSDFGSAYAAAGLPANGPAITKPLVRMMNALSDGTMIFIIFLASIVVLLISILCICFMISLQMERDRKEVGMLKALGVGRIQIRRIYVAKYLVFAVCGAGAGFLLAVLLSVPLKRQIQELYGMPEAGLQPMVFGIAAVVFTEGIFLFFIRQSLKKLERLSALEALFSSREQGRQAGLRQSLLVGFVAFACIFLALIPQNLYTTMSAPAFVSYMGIGNSDIRMDVRRTDDIVGITEQVLETLGEDALVKRYTALYTKPCMAVLPDGSIINLNVETGNHDVFPVSYLEGTFPKGKKEIALSSMNAEEMGLSVGDRLCLFTNGEETDFTVCGIYADITNGGKSAKAYQADDNAPVVWSVLYVSFQDKSAFPKDSPFKGFVEKEEWMEQYRRLGADVIDIADYVKETYGQTLKQILLASGIAFGVGASVIAVVVVLFMRLIVEQRRYSLSLYKALGFTTWDIKRIYFVKGMLPVSIGIVAGLFLGNMCGESICGIVLQSFGADRFRFVIDPAEVSRIVFCLLLTAVAAVWIGIAEIDEIKACECLSGQD